MSALLQVLLFRGSTDCPLGLIRHSRFAASFDYPLLRLAQSIQHRTIVSASLEPSSPEALGCRSMFGIVPPLSKVYKGEHGSDVFCRVPL